MVVGLAVNVFVFLFTCFSATKTIYKSGMIAATLVLFTPSLVLWSRFLLSPNLDEYAVYGSVAGVGVQLLQGKTKLQHIPGSFIYILFLVVGIFSNIYNDVDLVTGVSSVIAYSKWLILAFLLTADRGRSPNMETLRGPVSSMFFFALVTGIFNLLFPQTWSQITGVSASYGFIDRFSLAAVYGPFTHPAVFSVVMAICGIYFLVPASNSGHTPKPGKAFSSFLLSLLALRRRLWLGLFMAAVSALNPRSNRWGIWWMVTALVVAGVYVGSSFSTLTQAFFADYIDQDLGSTPRFAIAKGSLTLALRHFPIGAGLGTFGSSFDQLDSLRGFAEAGIATIWGLGGGNQSSYLADFFWGTLLGESGFVGLALFASSLMVVFFNWASLRNSSELETQRAGMWLVPSFVVLLVDSTSGSTFIGPLSSLFALLVATGHSVESKVGSTQNSKIGGESR